VSTNPPSRFVLDLYRSGWYGGAGARHVLRLGPFEGRVQPEPAIGPVRLRESRWEPCAALEIPADWPSGVYLWKLTAGRDGVQSYVVFIVRDERVADFVFQCSDLTWQAYNRWPDRWSLYDDGEKLWAWGPDADVGFDRPYAKYCQLVDAPLSTGSGEWLLWEFPLAYWMESQGYDVTYVSGVDTHRDPDALARARGFLSVGHDEYYTPDRVLSRLDRFVRRHRHATRRRDPRSRRLGIPRRAGRSARSGGRRHRPDAEPSRRGGVRRDRPSGAARQRRVQRVELLVVARARRAAWTCPAADGPLRRDAARPGPARATHHGQRAGAHASPVARFRLVPASSRIVHSAALRSGDA
jgi:hypothetical protein